MELELCKTSYLNRRERVKSINHVPVPVITSLYILKILHIREVFRLVQFPFLPLGWVGDVNGYENVIIVNLFYVCKINLYLLLIQKNNPPNTKYDLIHLSLSVKVCFAKINELPKIRNL